MTSFPDDSLDFLMSALQRHPSLAMAQVYQGRVVWGNEIWNRDFALLEDPGRLSLDALFVSPRSLEQFRQLVVEHFKEGLVCIEHELKGRDGKPFATEILLQTVSVSAAIVGDGLWLVRDIRLENNLRLKVRDLERHSRVLSTNPWGLSLVLNQNLYLTYASPSAESLIGYRNTEMLGEPLARYLSPTAFEVVQAHVLEVISGDSEAKKRTGRIAITGTSGHQRQFSYRLLDCQKVSRVRGIVLHAFDWQDTGQPDVPVPVLSAPVIAPDLSDSSSDVSKHIDSAVGGIEYDALTGLQTRIEAEKRLKQMLEANRAEQSRVALLWVDLDRLHDFNEAYGYAVVNMLLRRVATLLNECTLSGLSASLDVAPEERYLIARMSGGQFLIALSASNQSQAEALAQRLIERLQSDNLVPEVEQHLGASIGIVIDALDPSEREDADHFLLSSESAATQAKKQGGNQHFLFNPRLVKRRRTMRELDLEVRGGLERREFKMFYQPQLHLGTGQVVGVEALLRWQHPERGLLLPALFVEAFQRNRLLDVLTRWTLTQVGEQSAAWKKAGLIELPISVNLTEHQFQNPHLPSILASVLMKTGLSARNLILEVNEASLIESSTSLERTTNEIKQLGIRLAIDDFGVGYSSLNYLRQQIASQVKLGKAFVKELPERTECGAIVAAIVAIGKSLKFQVVAEHIETQVQVEALRSLGCETGQGFHLSVPLHAIEFQQFLLSRQTLNGT